MAEFHFFNGSVIFHFVRCVCVCVCLWIPSAQGGCVFWHHCWLRCSKKVHEETIWQPRSFLLCPQWFLSAAQFGDREGRCNLQLCGCVHFSARLCFVWREAMSRSTYTRGIGISSCRRCPFVVRECTSTLQGYVLPRSRLRLSKPSTLFLFHHSCLVF